MEDSGTTRTKPDERDRRGVFALRFVERFDDLFEFGFLSSLALGLLLAWIWMGLSEGYPAFMDGRVDLLSVILMLGSFAALSLCVAFNLPIRAFFGRPSVWFVLACAMAVVQMAMLVLYFFPDLLPHQVTLIFVRCGMVVIGAGASVLVTKCAVVFSCLRTASAAVGFVAATGFMFVAYFGIGVCEIELSGALFCLLPVAAVVCLIKERRVVTDRISLEPPETLAFAQGYRSMCLSFSVFFCAIGVKCAFEPLSEFAEGSDTSIICSLAVALIFLYLIALRRKPLGVFHVLKVLYGIAVMVLTVCIALAPLSIEPYITLLFNADVMIILMVFWLLTTFVAHFNEVHVCKVIGIAFAMAALGMLVGWTAGVVIYQILGHDRSYFTIALACATAVFSTVGFSNKSFPYLTQRGEGAKKMQGSAMVYVPIDYAKKMAADHGLSERETEVLELLVAGYGADAVADKLTISYHTARTHVRNIYRKMDVHSQREMLDLFEAVKQEHLDEWKRAMAADGDLDADAAAEARPERT